MRWFAGGLPRVAFVIISTLLIYASTLIGIRFGDRRALAQLNPFDFVVAVAFGSIVARTATSATPTYVEGLTALVTLLAAHRVLSIARRRSVRVRRVIDRPPVVLIRDGEIHEDAVAGADLTTSDLATLLREQGVRSVDEIELAVLEARGVVSVLRHGDTRIEPWLDCDTDT